MERTVIPYDEVDDILNATSVAIVGVSSRPDKFGSMFLASLLKMGFAGRIYPIHDRQHEVMGLRAYPTLDALPEAAELVYVAVPADQCLAVLRACMGGGIKAVVIMTSGFREAGGKGEALEAEAVKIARQGGFRIIGPNCFGIYNPGTRLTLAPGFDFSDQAGTVGFLSQSGGFAAHFARMGKAMGVGFSAVVSYGNGSDLDEADLLHYFSQHDRTRIIAGYLEGTRDGRRFYGALKEAAFHKPVVLWKVGRGEAARQAVLSHRGSLAGSESVWESVLAQCVRSS